MLVFVWARGGEFSGGWRCVDEDEDEDLLEESWRDRNSEVDGRANAVAGILASRDFCSAGDEGGWVLITVAVAWNGVV